MEKEKQNAPVRDEITFGEIFASLLNKWWVLVLSVLVGLVIGFVAEKITYSYTPQYTADVKMSFYTTDTNIGTSQAVTPYFMRRSFEYLSSEVFLQDELETRLENEAGIRIEIKTGGAYDKVQLQLRSEEVPNGYVRVSQGQLNLTYIFDTNASIFHVILTGADKEVVTKVAYRLAKEGYISDFLEKKIKDTNIQLECLSLPGYKLLNPNEGKTTMLKYLLISVVACFAVAAIAIVVVARLDTRIKRGEDISRLVGVPLLGEIPQMAEEDVIPQSGVKK